MKIKALELENFRCFDSFAINFSDQFNIHAIIAENMVGKSALMHALKLTANTYTSGLRTETQIRKEDHRVVGNNPMSDITSNVSIKAEALITDAEGRQVLSSWRKYKEKPVGGYTKLQILSGIDPKKQSVKTYDSSQQEGGAILPLFSFIGTEYIHVESSETLNWEINGKSIDAYKDCFEDKSIKKYLFNWLKKIDNIIIESNHKKIIFEAYQDIPLKALQVFQQAVISVLPDIIAIEWSNDAKQPIVKLCNGDIRLFDMLSDGYRYLITLAGELATRSFLLNKRQDDILNKIYGVVIIDEFGIHLHPALQNDSLIRLGKTFPNVQFIITTHSPLILNGLKKEQVHVLSIDSNGKRISANPDEDVIGMGADQIITKIFGLSTTLDKEYLKLSEEYKQLFSKKEAGPLSKEEEESFKELSGKLAYYRLDPQHKVGEEDTLTTLVKEQLGKQEVNNLTAGEAEELNKTVGDIIDKIFNKKS